MGRWLAAATMALAGALLGCDDDPAGAPGGERAVGPGDEYVALGDSYTAAPNTGPIADSDGCFTSEVNYPRRIAAALGLDLTDNSCSGASTRELLHRQRTPVGHRPAQLDDVGRQTDLVTIRLGANDAGLYSRIVTCARVFGPGAGGTPCADVDATNRRDHLAAAVARLLDDLILGLDQIRARAPSARILVIGYPRVVPESGTCPELPLPAGDHAYAREIIEGINGALEAAAAEVGVGYVDMYGVSAGHDICGREPWIAGANRPVEGATPWHPYAAESRAVAERVVAELLKSR